MKEMKKIIYLRCEVIELGQVAIVDVATKPVTDTLELRQIPLVNMVEVVSREFDRGMVAGLPLDK